MARGEIGVGDKGESPTGSLNCTDVKDLFPDYFTGHLSPFQAVLFEEHRATCASCRSELAVRARGAMRVRPIPHPAYSKAGTGERLRRLLFRPVHVKLPLEAAGLVLVAGLAIYVVHHSSPPTVALKRFVAAPEQQAVAEHNVETVRSEFVGEIPAARPSIVEAKPEERPAFKPQPPPARPAPRRMESPPIIAENAVPGGAVETQPANERIASAERGADADASSAREPIIPEATTEIPGKDRAGEPDPAAMDNPLISPDDFPYFFL